MLKRFLLYLISFSVILCAGCKKSEEDQDLLLTIKERGKIVVGVKYDSRPFGYVDEKGKLKGYDIDLAKIIARRLLGSEKKVVFKEVNQHTRISRLNAGDIDMIIATMTITPQREAVVSFSIPYYTTGQALLVKKNSPIRGIGELNGKKVIAILNTTGEKNLRYFAPGALFQGYRSYEEGFSALKAGKADAMTADETILVGLALSNPDYKVLPQRYTSEYYAVAFRKNQQSESLKIDINNILTDMQKNGELNTLKARWIPPSYQGDIKMKKILDKTPKHKK